MRSLANRYVRYFNAGRKQTGTIWEGRFKSYLVDSDSYLFALYKYIEMNPVKANMVADAADYKWSSYPHNALGQNDKLISEHALYTDLGRDVLRRCERYVEIFKEGNSTTQENQITRATVRGEVYGSEIFHQKISALISRSTKLSTHGGDRKSEVYRDQAG